MIDKVEYFIKNEETELWMAWNVKTESIEWVEDMKHAKGFETEQKAVDFALAELGGYAFIVVYEGHYSIQGG